MSNNDKDTDIKNTKSMREKEREIERVKEKKEMYQNREKTGKGQRERAK